MQLFISDQLRGYICCDYYATSLFASDCNPGMGIEKFVIPGSRFGIGLTEWSLFWYR